MLRLGLLACFLFAGCVQPPPPQQPAPDPFVAPGLLPNDCPDGRCPSGDTGSGGTEISSTNTSLVNELALNEVKNEECLPCNQQPQLLTTRTQEAKHGTYRCQMCQRRIVGDQYEDLWTDDGLSLHCVCKECFARATPQQREQTLRTFVARSDPKMLERSDVQSAIREASHR
jgi:hypothetical protein